MRQNKASPSHYVKRESDCAVFVAACRKARYWDRRTDQPKKSSRYYQCGAGLNSRVVNWLSSATSGRQRARSYFWSWLPNDWCGPYRDAGYKAAGLVKRLINRIGILLQIQLVMHDVQVVVGIVLLRIGV